MDAPLSPQSEHPASTPAASGYAIVGTCTPFFVVGLLAALGVPIDGMNLPLVAVIGCSIGFLLLVLLSALIKLAIPSRSLSARLTPLQMRSYGFGLFAGCLLLATFAAVKPILL